MDKKYNIKLDLQFRCNNSIMQFSEFDNNTADFFLRITNGDKPVENLKDAIVILAIVKPSNIVDSQFIEVQDSLVYADLKPSVINEVGKYKAKAMLIYQDERVTTDVFEFEKTDDDIFVNLNKSVVADERFTLLTDMLTRLSTIETTEEQRQINESERILQEEQRQINETNRVKAELVREHQEADREKAEAIREEQEHNRQLKESERVIYESKRNDDELVRIANEEARKLNEQARVDNYNFMTEDEERRRLEANQHKANEEARKLSETDRVNEESKRRTVEQARVSSENQRKTNETNRVDVEATRNANEQARVDEENNRSNRFNTFIVDAENQASNFENYTNQAKIDEEERKTNEANREVFENKRKSNESDRITKENQRNYNETNRVNAESIREREHDAKLVEASEKIDEVIKITADMVEIVDDKTVEIENRFNNLTAAQQGASEVIDARDNEVSLKARLDRDAKLVKVMTANVEGSFVTVNDSVVAPIQNIEILGQTYQDPSNLSKIVSCGIPLGDGQYKMSILSTNTNIMSDIEIGRLDVNTGNPIASVNYARSIEFIPSSGITNLKLRYKFKNTYRYHGHVTEFDGSFNFIKDTYKTDGNFVLGSNTKYIKVVLYCGTSDAINLNDITECQLEVGTTASEFTPAIQNKSEISMPCQLEGIGEYKDILYDDGNNVVIEKNQSIYYFTDNDNWVFNSTITAGGVNKAYVLNNVITNVKYEHSKILIMSNKYKAKRNYSHTEDIEGIMFINANSLVIRTNKELNELKESLKGSYLIFPTTQPNKIVLPKTGKLNLTSHADKTHIYMTSGEVDGTIKCKVSKSMGASVNANTNAITEVRKQVEDIANMKGSEDVHYQTDSGYLVCKETNEGVVKNLELKGKTLVNISNIKTGAYSPDGVSECGVSNYIKIHSDNITCVLNIVVNTVNSATKTRLTYEDGTHKYYTNIEEGFNGVKVLHFEREKKIKEIRIFSDSSSVGEFKIDDFLVIEGNHTNNPPAYFEGIKSVGEDVEEIEVLSCNNGNLFYNIETEKGFINASNGQNGDRDDRKRTVGYIEICPNFEYEVLNGVSVSNFFWYDNNKNYIGYEIGTKSLSPSNAKYLRLYTIDFNNDYKLGINGFNPDVENIFNKKPVLYKDEDGSFKAIGKDKPLREWDYTTKDGKVVFGSEQVVFNGADSEVWTLGSKDGKFWFNISVTNKGVGSLTSKCISDKFIDMGSYVEMQNKSGVMYFNGTQFNFNAKEGIDSVDKWKAELKTNPITVTYKIVEPKTYDLAPTELNSYANETMIQLSTGAINCHAEFDITTYLPNTVKNCIDRLNRLEKEVYKYQVTQNRLQLTSTYRADSVTFKVDYNNRLSISESNNDLYDLILANIVVGKENYNYDSMFTIILDYASWSEISWEQFDILVGVMDHQHNPPIIEPEETPNM